MLDQESLDRISKSVAYTEGRVQNTAGQPYSQQPATSYVLAGKTAGGISAGGVGDVIEWWCNESNVWEVCPSGNTFKCRNFFDVAIPGSTKVYIARVGAVWAVISQQC